MKIIEVDKLMPLINNLSNLLEALKTLIQASQREESVVVTPPVIPPVVPPVVPPVTPPGPTTGIYKDAVAGAYKLNTIIKTQNGLPTSFGYGFKDQCVPGPAYVLAGRKAYFLADPSWVASLYTTFKFKVFDMSVTPGFKITLYEIDSLDNGTFIRTTGESFAMFIATKKAGVRYLFEVDATNCPNGFSLGITWPK